MNEQSGFDKPSPLRNSRAANRPFQSPFRSVLSPSKNFNAKEKQPKIQSPRSSLVNRAESLHSANLTTPEKRTIEQPHLLAKKICSKNFQLKSEEYENRETNEGDPVEIRERISRKKENLEHMKRQLLYRDKHKPQDLINLTERWINGCQEALIQFQKDLSQQKGNAVDIAEILSLLGIPPELVRYSIEDCDFL